MARVRKYLTAKESDGDSILMGFKKRITGQQKIMAEESVKGGFKFYVACLPTATGLLAFSARAQTAYGTIWTKVLQTARGQEHPMFGWKKVSYQEAETLDCFTLSGRGGRWVRKAYLETTWNPGQTIVNLSMRYRINPKTVTDQTMLVTFTAGRTLAEEQEVPDEVSLNRGDLSKNVFELNLERYEMNKAMLNRFGTWCQKNAFAVAKERIAKFNKTKKL